jgi:hypothetical protein
MWGNKEDASAKRAAKSNTRNDKSVDPRRYLNNHPAHQQNRAPSNALQTASGDHGPGQSKNWQVELSQQILVHHQAEPYSVGTDWMSRLKEDSIHYLQEKQGMDLTQVQMDSVYKKGIEILVDKIFSLLQRFMYEFNKVAAGTNLHVSGTISGDVTEVTRYNKFREAEETKTYFRARFSTRLYSLVFRGREESVDVFLLPVNRTMALSKGENEYKPLATIQVKITDEGMMWRLAEGNPPVDSLENLCMWLFSELIERTKGASADDPD